MGKRKTHWRGHRGKIFAFVGMAVIGGTLYFGIQAGRAQTTVVSAPASHTSCLPTKDYANSNGYLESYTRSNNCHQTKVFYNYGDFFQNSDNLRVRCPAGATVQTHNSGGGWHYSMSPNISGAYDGPAHHFCVNALGIQVDYEIVDVTSPTISAVGSSNLTQATATITWTTNENADSQVEYGTTTYNLASATTIDPTMTMTHSVNLTGLTAGTTYNFNAKSKDAAGNLTYFAGTFVTQAAPTCALGLTLANGKTSYVKGESVNYTYTCSPAGTRASNATVQVVKPDGTATTYVTGTNIDTATLGFATTNLTAGTYALRVCIDPTCTSTTSSMSSVTFTVTDTAGTTVQQPTGMTLQGTVLKDGQYIDPATGTARTCVSPNAWMKEGPTATGARGFHCMQNYTATATDNPPTPCAGTLYTTSGTSTGSFTSDYCSTTAPTPTTTCAAPTVLCPATGTTAAYCASTCGSTVPPSPPTPPPPPPANGGCPNGDSNCRAAGSYGSISAWCSNSMKCYQKEKDADLNNDIHCAPTPAATATTPAATMGSASCIAGYGSCARDANGNRTDPNCKENADKWNVSDPTKDNSYCSMGQKCNYKDGGRECKAWGDDCGGDALYCSSNTSGQYSKCVEPDKYETLVSGVNSYWCGQSGGMTFYSATQVFCAKKPASSAGIGTMMWTGADVKQVLNKLGAEFGLCNKNQSGTNSWICGEPGQTISSNGGCAWMPPMTAGTGAAYMTPSAGATRTCPSLDDSGTVPPPSPICPAVTATMCPAGEEHGPSVADSNGCYLPGPCRKKIICPMAPTFNSCPAGQVLKTTTGDCPMTYCVNPNEMRECASGEMPNSNNMCRMPMYRWVFDKKDWEKCDASAPQSYVSVKGNMKAVATNCESFNFDIDKEWKTERNLLHDPRIDGDFYNPPWNASAKFFEYDPPSDQFAECKLRPVTSYAVRPGDVQQYQPSCLPILEVDRGWMFKKSRAEYRMWQLWSQQKQPDPKPLPDKCSLIMVPSVSWCPSGQKLKVTGGECPTSYCVDETEVVEIPAAQCKAYLGGIKQTLTADKLFWKDVQRQLDQAVGYSDTDAVKKLLEEAKGIILEVDKLSRIGCAKDNIALLQKRTATLHTDIFSKLGSYLPELRDYGAGVQCRVRLESRVVKLKDLFEHARNEEQKAAIGAAMESLDAKVAELKASHDFDYDALAECEDFERDFESGLATLLRENDTTVSRQIEDIISKKLEPVIAKLEEQINERGKKLDELLVKIAELNNTITTLTKSAADIQDRLTVSISAASQISNAEVRSEIQTQKDKLIPLVQSLGDALPQCLSAAQRESLGQRLGEVIVINWLPALGEEIGNRLQILANACKAKDLTAEDIAAFRAKYEELARQNATLSVREHVTFSADVPSHEWYFGAFQFAHDAGFVSQGRPAEATLRQDANLMIARAAGENNVTGTCALRASGVASISPYAVCAANRAYERGLALPRIMTAPITRAEVAMWIVRLVDLPLVGSENHLARFTDIDGLTEPERSAIATMAANGIMVGTASPDGVTSTFDPRGQLTRASLVVILQKVAAAANSAGNSVR